MYNDEVMDRYQNPRYFGKLSEYNITIDEASTTCGDKIILFIKEKEGVIEDIGFEGDGCIISMVSADIFCEKAKGKKVEDVGETEESIYLETFPVEITPGRINCALLPLRAFKRYITKMKK